MAYQEIGLGTTEGDGTGDSIRDGGDKVNDNFVEIYTLLGTGTALSSGISATASVVTLASPTITGVASFADGSASAPSFTNSGDTNTGIYFSAADTVAVTTGGTLRTTVDSTGLDVTGALTATSVAGRKLIDTSWNTSSAHTDTLTVEQSGATVLVHGTAANVINLPAAATTNVGLTYEIIILTAVGGSVTTTVVIPGSGGQFVGALSLAGGTAANAVFDVAGDTLTFVANTVIGSRARITCLSDDGTDGVYQIECLASPIATIA